MNSPPEVIRQIDFSSMPPSRGQALVAQRKALNFFDDDEVQQPAAVEESKEPDEVQQPAAVEESKEPDEVQQPAAVEEPKKPDEVEELPRMAPPPRRVAPADFIPDAKAFLSGAQLMQPASQTTRAPPPTPFKKRKAPEPLAGQEPQEPFELTFGTMHKPLPGTPVYTCGGGQGIHSVIRYNTMRGMVAQKTEPFKKRTLALLQALYKMQNSEQDTKTIPLLGCKVKGTTMVTVWEWGSDPHPTQGCVRPDAFPSLLFGTLPALQRWRLHGVFQNDIKAANLTFGAQGIKALDWGNESEGDVSYMKLINGLESFIMAADQSLYQGAPKGLHARCLYDQVCMVFFIGCYMTGLSFSQVLEFTASPDFASRFPELATHIACIREVYKS
jgi:hypothetical protein